MPERVDAEEHLRVIRDLMERATHYRTVSAQGALVGGALSLAAGVWMYLRGRAHPDCVKCTLWVWGLVLAFTALANLAFLMWDDRKHGRAFFSSRALWALKALAPALLLGAAASWPVANETLFALGLLWSGCYAVALLAAGHFAPPSLTRLGRAFFVATAVVLALPFVAPLVHIPLEFIPPDAVFFELYMACTFGVFHLVYALCTWPRGAASTGHV